MSEVRSVPLPNAQDIDRMLAFMKYNDFECIKICRGTKKGCNGERELGECQDCYCVPWWDKRSGAEILAAMERGDA